MMGGFGRSKRGWGGGASAVWDMAIDSLEIMKECKGVM